MTNWAVLMCLYNIATEYNGQLEAAHAHIDNDRYDIVECGAAGQRRLVLSYQLRSCIIASTIATRLGSANVLV